MQVDRHERDDAASSRALEICSTADIIRLRILTLLSEYSDRRVQDLRTRCRVSAAGLSLDEWLLLQDQAAVRSATVSPGEFP
jgi:hypothetical protein